MCGIAGGQAPWGDVEAALDAIAHRGPDGRGIEAVDGWVLGHVRLSIIDPTDASAQPMRRGATTVSYNGELWNYRELRTELEGLGRTFHTSGDTEVLAHALDEWGTDALERLNSMMAVAWVSDGILHLARDRYGEVPLHVGRRPDGGIVFSSELKGMVALGAAPQTVQLVEPASWMSVAPDGDGRTAWYERIDLTPSPDDRDTAAPIVRGMLADACGERSVSDVPVACLVSGGIDSSAVALLLAPHVPDLELYTAVHDPKSQDLRCSRDVADALGLKLHEVAVPAPSADDLSSVVRAIEMPSKAQVEIGWACLHLARALQEDGVKVTFSGEGSDEMWASYANSFHNIKRSGWYPYRRDAVLGQHRKNFARCNKVFMAHSVECRLPFLHPPLVRYALRLRRDAVFGPFPEALSGRPTTVENDYTEGGGKEKMVLRQGFVGDLPDRVIARNKMAFQDGAGLKTAAADAVADPLRFYRAEYARLYPGVKW